MSDHGSLAAAVLAFQAECPPIERDATGQHSKYATYEAVKATVQPLLTKHGLVWTVHPKGTYLEWHLIHVKSSQEFTGTWDLPASANPQVLGSASTYGRRYCLEDVLDVVVAGEDDDGAQGGSGAPESPVRTRTKIPGPDHERIVQGTVRGRVEGAERGPVPDTQNRWEAATPAQVTLINTMFTRHGITDRDVKLGMLSKFVDRGLGSSKELTKAEASRWIDEYGEASD